MTLFVRNSIKGNVPTALIKWLIYYFKYYDMIILLSSHISNESAREPEYRSLLPSIINSTNTCIKI